MIYLDAATTLKPSDDIVSRAKNALENAWGNVSGTHGISREAKNLLEAARENVSIVCGVTPENILFPSGATDALNIVIQGYKRSHADAKIFCTKIEHDAVYKTCEALDAKFINVDEQGRVKTEELEEIHSGDLVCVMAVNNETGVVQDLESIANIVHEKGALLLVDAVQSFYAYDAKTICDLADYAVFSGHKLGSLQGVGMLMIKNRKSISSLMYGGSQEWELRPGTTRAYLCDSFSNVFGNKFDEQNRENEISYVKKLRDDFENMIKDEISDVVINSCDADRSAHISSIRFTDIESQMMVAMLDEQGICVSKGSACASGASTPSHVLMAMNLSEDEALSTIRISFSKDNTDEEVRIAVQKIAECVENLRSFKMVAN